MTISHCPVLPVREVSVRVLLPAAITPLRPHAHFKPVPALLPARRLQSATRASTIETGRGLVERSCLAPPGLPLFFLACPFFSVRSPGWLLAQPSRPLGFSAASWLFAALGLRPPRRFAVLPATAGVGRT